MSPKFLSHRHMLLVICITKIFAQTLFTSHLYSSNLSSTQQQSKWSSAMYPVLNIIHKMISDLLKHIYLLVTYPHDNDLPY